VKLGTNNKRLLITREHSTGTHYIIYTPGDIPSTAGPEDGFDELDNGVITRGLPDLRWGGCGLAPSLLPSFGETPSSDGGDLELDRPGMALIGGRVRGVLLEPPDEPTRRGGEDPAPGGECDVGDAREDGPLLLAS